MEEIKALEMGTQPQIEQPPKSKFTFSPPKWSKFVVIFALLVSAVVLVVRCAREDGAAHVNTKALAPVDKQSLQNIGSNPSEEYREGLNLYTEQKTQESVRTGSTFVPPVSPGRPILTVDDGGKEQGVTPTAPANAQRQGRADQSASTRVPRQRADFLPYLSSLENRLMGQTSAQSVTVHNKPSSKVQPVPVSTLQQQASVAPGLTPGDILYAISSLTLDSDAPGPVLAKVVGREYKGSKVTGAFRRSGEHLTLEFDAIITPEGKSYKIKGYAIDPATDRTGVRSSVDTHFLERWGGLVMSSFLQGLGQATSQSGTTSYQGPWGSTTSTPRFNLQEQLLIAGGKVGERAANVFERNFDRPPTVTLKAGLELGILIVTVTSSTDQVSPQIPAEYRNTNQPSPGQTTRQRRNYEQQ